MKSVVVIPARYGSIRLPGKALADIAGKPLIQWVYERACESTLTSEVIVATDDERIREACLAFGAPVAMTSADCRSGTDRVHEAIRGRDADIIVNLQGDEPQIRGDMIDTLIRAMTSEASFEGEAPARKGHDHRGPRPREQARMEGATRAPVIALDMATLCAYITEPHDYKSPHTAKVVLDKNGFALYFSRAPLPFFQQKVSIPTYRHIGIYAFSRSFLETFVALPKGRLEEAESLEQLRALEAGYRIKTLLVDYEGIGVDTENDLQRVREILG